MRHARILIILATLLCACPSFAADGMDGLYSPPEGTRMRSSSFDRPDWQNGNGDNRPLLPGQPLVLIDADGPGIVEHIWMTIASRDHQYPRTYALRVYYDGAKNPSVESPVGDFFAVGHGMDVPVNSMPVDVSSDGRARNSWWPMPFKKHIKITLTNEEQIPTGAILYWFVDWQKVDSLPEDTLYFHAQYRQEFPCKPGDYTILETQGKGRYVGTVLSVLHNMPSWFGEGDDMFYIDGETVPSLIGTGTEDYFADAWGFRWFNHPYHGVTVWEGSSIEDRGTAYRWHVLDPITFQKSLRLTIEHKGPVFDEKDSMRLGYGERSDDFSTVAFWYQEGTPEHFYTMPKGEKRLPQHIYIEAEKRYYQQKSMPPEAAIETDARWSGGAIVVFKPSKADKKYEMKFKVENDLRYFVRADLAKGPDMGVFMVLLDGRMLDAALDLSAGDRQPLEKKLGAVALSPGEHTLVFEPVRPGTGGGRSLGIDGLYVRPIKIYHSWEK